MLILGIDTSCDETAIALIQGKKGKCQILSNAVFSQIKIHKKYKGIVPEIAARAHLEKILPVLNQTISKKNLTNIDLITVTNGPGLITSLLVGIELGKTLSYALKKPLLPINHLAGHIYANWLVSGNKIKFPVVCLVVSGGHTELVLMKGHGQYQRLGGTRDDAAGECLDKTARLLGLGYPGGPAIEKVAKLGSPAPAGSRAPIVLPRPMIYSKDFDFSFSGLKTAVLYKTRERKFMRKKFVRSLAWEIEQAVVDVLSVKTMKAVKKFSVKTVILGGGVVANQKLRERMEEETDCSRVKLFLPPKNLCTDNGAMIAAAGYFTVLRFNPEQYKFLFLNWQKIQPKPNLKLG